MPGIERAQGFAPRSEQLNNRIQELKARAAEGLDDAMNLVEKNLGRQEAREASAELKGLGEELVIQKESMHRLDPLVVADLISDPFED